VARAAPEGPHPLPAVVNCSQKQLKADLSVNHISQSPGNPASDGAHCAEVEVDRITGQMKGPVMESATKS